MNLEQDEPKRWTPGLGTETGFYVHEIFELFRESSPQARRETLGSVIGMHLSIIPQALRAKELRWLTEQSVMMCAIFDEDQP